MATPTRPNEISDNFDIAAGWVMVAHDSIDDTHLDFEKTLFRSHDTEHTSIDMRVTFNTEARDAQVMLLRRDGSGKEQPILAVWAARWDAALQMIGATPKPGCASLSPFTVIGFYESSGSIACHHVEATSGLNAFAQAATTSDELEMVAALAGRFTEGDLLTFPGESVVCSDTVLGQPDVFGEPDEDRTSASGPRP